MYEQKLAVLVPRSFEMYEFMEVRIEQLHKLAPRPELNFRMAFQFGLLSYEHGLASLKLIENGHYSSGFALMRPQYESLVRAMWIMFANIDTWMSKLSAANKVGPDELKKLETPNIGDMLKALKESKAPADIIEQIEVYRQVNNAAFNSFTHSGLIALFNNHAGFEPKLMYDAIRNCNGMASINFQMLSILTGYAGAMKDVRELPRKFIDCLPIIHE